MVIFFFLRRVCLLKVVHSGWGQVSSNDEKAVELLDHTSKVDIFTKMLKDLLSTLKQAA